MVELICDACDAVTAFFKNKKTFSKNITETLLDMILRGMAERVDSKPIYKCMILFFNLRSYLVHPSFYPTSATSTQTVLGWDFGLPKILTVLEIDCNYRVSLSETQS